MKVLFTDLNGTLSVRGDFTPDFVNLSKGPLEQLALLKQDIPDLKLVIISDIRFSKRGSTMGRVLSFLDTVGFEDQDILPPTPKHDSRELEIASWLEQHGKTVSHYAVIDDNWLSTRNFVSIDTDTGFNEAARLKVLDLLR